MRIIFDEFINDKLKLEKHQKIGVIFLVIVLSGFFGWVYEFFFYYLNSDMKEFYWQGGNFLPWINIYATGAVLIYLFCRKIKKNPYLVFFISMLVTGILEYVSGFLIFHLFDGKRLWDYNVERWNFGNIDGFVCLRSILFFGISALILMYVMIPFCIYISKKLKKRAFMIISISLFSIVMFDELYNLIIARVLHIPRAYDIYHKLGIKYLNF